MSISKLLGDGLWRQNAALVQLLGLCPLLAVTTSLVNGVGLGLATTIVLMLSGVLVALIRNLVPSEIRIPVYIVVIAVSVTVVQLLMNAYLYPLYVVLGIFVPLIVTNCLVLARAEAFASKHNPGAALLDGLFMGLGLTLVLGVLGAMRELIGQGTVLVGIERVFGESAKAWTMQLVPPKLGFSLALMPVGGFLCLGVLIALKNMLSRDDAPA